MRNRDILADAGRPEGLAALQHFHEGLLGLVVQLEQAHELLQDIVFCGALQLQVDGVFGKELTQAHVLVPPVETAAKRNGWLLLAQRVITLRSEEHTSELQSRLHLVCRLLLEKKKKKNV